MNKPKELIKKLLPWANKAFLCKVINPFLKLAFHNISPKNSLHKQMKVANIEYLNLGGFRPVEQYLGIQLSPVEIYGIPFIKHNTFSLIYNSETAEFKQHERELKSPTISLHYNLLKGVPLNSEAISGINMSHILEHFTRDDALKVLKECYRVLKPNGVLRISCPDLLKYAKAYVNRDASFFDSLPIQKACLYDNLTTYGDRFISKAYDNDLAYGHKWFYDAESTIELVKLAGFTKVEERCLHDSLLPNIAEVEPAYRVFESFYIEATK